MAKEGKTAVFIDETGFSQRPNVASTWARRGQTPVLRECFNWKKASAIVALSATLQLIFRLIDGAFNGQTIISFLKQLIKRVKGRIVVFWDGAPIHRSQSVKEFLKLPRIAERLEVVALPAYAPELNPDEWIFGHVKAARMNGCAPATMKEVKDRARRELSRLAHKPQTLRNFLMASELPDMEQLIRQIN